MRAAALLPMLALVSAPALQAPTSAPRSAPAHTFETQQIRDSFGVGYAVTTADVNGDARPDILAISGTELVWFENPSWQMHVALDGRRRRTT